MNNGIQVFFLEENEAKAILQDGKTGCVVKDVSNLFSETNRNRATQGPADDEKGYTLMNTPGKTEYCAIINESGHCTLFITRRPQKAFRVSDDGSGVRKVFICSRYRPDDRHTVQDAVSSALFACGQAIHSGCIPIAPHVYIPRCLSYNRPEERAIGMVIGRELMKMCDEVWQWGKTVTEGMAEDLAYARELGKPIHIFNTIGIPYTEWNTVKFANLLSAEELADLDWAERTNDMASYNAKWGNGKSGLLRGVDRHEHQ